MKGLTPIFTIACAIIFGGGEIYGQVKAPKQISADWSKCCLTNTGVWRDTGYSQVNLRGWHVSSNGRVLWAVGSNGLILQSTDGGVTWTKKTIETKQILTAVLAAADGRTVWVSALTDEPNRRTGTLYKSADAGEHWMPVTGMSVPIDYLAGTPAGTHLWAISTYIRAGQHDVFGRYGQRLFHIMGDALVSKMESPVSFDEFRHGIAASDDGALLSGFGHEQGRGGTWVLSSRDSGNTWKSQVLIESLKLHLDIEGGNSATVTPDGRRIAVTSSLVAFYSQDAGRSWSAKPLARGGFDLLKLMPSELWLLSHDGELRKVRLAAFGPLDALGGLSR